MKYYINPLPMDKRNEFEKQLFVEADLGHLQAVQKLVSGIDLQPIKFTGYEVSVNRITESIGRAFLAAAMSGHLEVAEFLVSVSGDYIPNLYMNEHGPKVIEYALRAAYSGTTGLETVRYLVSLGANVAVDNNIAICYAAANGHMDVIKFMIEHGADIKAEGYRPITDAIMYRRLDVVEYAIPKMVSARYGNSMFFRRAVCFSQTEIIKYLISVGANVTSNNNEAIRRSVDLEIIKLLVEHGADVKVSDNIILVNASLRGQLETVKFLVDSGADVGAAGNASIRCAVKHGYLHIIKYLISIGADYSKCGLHKLIGSKRLPGSREEVLLAVDMAMVNRE